MTEKEATETLQELSLERCAAFGVDCGNCDKCGATKAYNMAIKALEKQTPKKPKNEYTDNLDITTEIPICPVCGNQSIDETNEYCSDCGQALDWSNEK